MTTYDTSSDGAVEFLRQVADLIAVDNLPAPTSVTVYSRTVLVDDQNLAPWQRALELAEPTWEERGEWEHARFAGQSPTGIALASCRQVPVSTVELYECAHCDAKFGIAGTSNGSDEDIAAGEYFDDQVRFHDSGECKRTAVTA